MVVKDASAIRRSGPRGETRDPSPWRALAGSQRVRSWPGEASRSGGDTQRCPRRPRPSSEWASAVVEAFVVTVGQRARPVRVPPGTEGSRREFALLWIAPHEVGLVASVEHSQRPLTVPGGTLTGLSCAHRGSGWQATLELVPVLTGNIFEAAREQAGGEDRAACRRRDSGEETPTREHA